IRCTDEGPDGSTVKVPDQTPRTQATSEPETDCPGASRFPWNRRVQAHETRIPNEVAIFCEVVYEFRRQERRAHASEAVRVIDADPEDHRILERRPLLKSTAPANIQIA